MQRRHIRITRPIIIPFMLRKRRRLIRRPLNRLRRIRTLDIPFHSGMRRQIDLLMVAQVAAAADGVHVWAGGVGAEDHAFVQSGASGAEGCFEGGAVEVCAWRTWGRWGWWSGGVDGFGYGGVFHIEGGGGGGEERCEEEYVQHRRGVEDSRSECQRRNCSVR